MNVYVASSFLNKPEVNEAQQKLREAGHTISHDWTPDVAPGERGSPEYNRYIWHAGRKDYDGIMLSDAMLFLNDTRCRDAFTEMGMFLGMRRPVFFVRGDAFLTQFTTVFIQCPGVVVCDTVEQALLDLERWQDGRHVYTKGEPDCVRCGAFGPMEDADGKGTCS